jgi:hypothetical protein
VLSGCARVLDGEVSGLEDAQDKGLGLVAFRQEVAGGESKVGRPSRPNGLSLRFRGSRSEEGEDPRASLALGEEGEESGDIR